MNKKGSKTESVKNLNANGINYEKFKAICLVLGNGFRTKNIGSYSNLMKIDEWISHFNQYLPKLKQTKEEIILIFNHLINFHKNPQIIIKISGTIDTYAAASNIIISETTFADEILIYSVLNEK